MDWEVKGLAPWGPGVAKRQSRIWVDPVSGFTKEDTHSLLCFVCLRLKILWEVMVSKGRLRTWWSGPQRSAFQALPPHSRWLWTSYLTSLSLSFVICKLGVVCEEGKLYKRHLPDTSVSEIIVCNKEVLTVIILIYLLGQCNYLHLL